MLGKLHWNNEQAVPVTMIDRRCHRTPRQLTYVHWPETYSPALQEPRRQVVNQFGVASTHVWFVPSLVTDQIPVSTYDEAIDKVSHLILLLLVDFVESK